MGRGGVGTGRGRTRLGGRGEVGVGRALQEVDACEYICILYGLNVISGYYVFW